MKSGAVNGSKMTFDSTHFFFKYSVEESGIEFADSCGSGCYIHRLLATSQHHLHPTKIKQFAIYFLPASGPPKGLDA